MINLKKAQINSTLTVDKIIGGAHITQRLMSLGLYPTAKIMLLNKSSVYIIAIRGSRIAISEDIVEQIFVKQQLS